MDVLLWLKSRNCPFSEESIKSASDKSHYDVVKWLHAEGMRHPHVTVNAAYDGNLDMLKWLLDEKVHFTSSPAALAAEQGHLHVLKWLHENNLPLDIRVKKNALFYKYKAILEWLRKEKIVLEKCADASQNSYVESEIYWMENHHYINQ